MRDLAVFLAVFGSLPFIFYRPWWGILVLAWLGYMNPHRLAYGAAVNFPFVSVVFITFLTAFLVNKDKTAKLPVTRETVLLFIFVVWMFITTLNAFYPTLAWAQWDKVWKIQLIVLFSLLVINNRERIDYLIWTIVLSLGFYGVKGGIFTIITAGAYRVQGPSGTFIGGNNEIGLAMLVAIPLMRYIQLSHEKKLIKISMNVMMFLTMISIVGTHSRGALVGAVLMGLFMIWKSRKRFVLLIMAASFIGLVMHFAPSQWFERMETIETYDEDKSAMGRINAWWMAYNLAKDNPVGGGYDTFQPPMFHVYAPLPWNVHDAHSIYFEVLGEQGFIGLTLFLILWWFTWASATQVLKKTKKVPEKQWMYDLASMLQVSIIAYATGGAFLGLAYFDLPYHLIVMVVVLKTLALKKDEASSKIINESSDVKTEVSIKEPDTEFKLLSKNAFVEKDRSSEFKILRDFKKKK